jgi:hypothetical protein
MDLFSSPRHFGKARTAAKELCERFERKPVQAAKKAYCTRNLLFADPVAGKLAGLGFQEMMLIHQHQLLIALFFALPNQPDKDLTQVQSRLPPAEVWEVLFIHGWEVFDQS